MRLRLVRHATLQLDLGGRRVLVDPMLSPAGSMPAIEGTPQQAPNPLVDLPEAASDVAAGTGVVLVTHLHDDHCDDDLVEVLPRDVPVLCQPEDVGFFKSKRGFEDVRPVPSALEAEGLHVTRTGGRHGHGALAEALAPVSGFVLRAPGEPVTYVAGDTVWCDEVAAALDAHAPDVVVVNAGGARFLEGEPITMTAADVVAVARRVPGAEVVAVHLEAINHCVETRAQLRAAVAAAGLADRVHVPDDGATAA